MENPKASSKQQREIFNAIVSFVNDLFEVYGTKKKATPLTLYHRLVQNIKIGDGESIQKAISGFTSFLKIHELSLIRNTLENIPQGTLIKYGDSERVCLEIQKYFHQSKKDESTTAIIRQHLLTIGMLINPSKDKIKNLENVQREREQTDASIFANIDTSTKEGKFVADILETSKNSMENIDTSDPMKAMMGVYQSGVLQKMMNGIQSGDMNPKALGRMMKKTLNTLLPDSDDEDSPAEKCEDPNADEGKSVAEITTSIEECSSTTDSPVQPPGVD